jgi:hypothetical protein
MSPVWLFSLSRASSVRTKMPVFCELNSCMCDLLRTLICAELHAFATAHTMSPTYISKACNVRFSSEKLSVFRIALRTRFKEGRFCAAHDPRLPAHCIDAVWEEICDDRYDGRRAIDDASVRAVVYGELE